MSRVFQVCFLAAFIVAGVYSESEAARQRFLFKSRGQQPAVTQVSTKAFWWPWDTEDEVTEPEPDVVPEPQPEPEPLPDSIDDLVEPEPEAEPAIPTDPTELNVYIGGRLGGYVRANHTKDGVELDIYQAEGKRRGVYEVADCGDWRAAIGKVAYLKGKTGADYAGLVLVCDKPTETEEEEPATPEEPESADTDSEPTEPEELPTPDSDEGSSDADSQEEEADSEEGSTVPDPAEDELPKPTPEEEQESLVIFTCGGSNLLDANTAAKAIGLRLYVVHQDTGVVNRVE